MITILGNGYFSKEFQKLFTERNVNYEVLYRGIFDFNLLSEYLKKIQPELLINCAGAAGKPNIDYFEDHELECLESNVVLPRRINQACIENKIPWVHVSSACIYSARGNGCNDWPKTELDTPDYTFINPPTSFYSGSKHLTEELIKDNINLYIVRPRMPFSHVNSPKNYLTKILSYKKIFSARNSLTNISDFTSAVLEMWEKHVPYGIYNIVNPGHLSAREISELIKTHLRTSNYNYKNKEWVFFDNEEEFLKTVKCPRSNVVLSAEKLLSTGVKMRSLEESMCWSLKNWID